MEPVTRVQIPDEAVFVSLRANAIGESVNTSTHSKVLEKQLSI